MVLDKIQRPNDVKELKEQELPILADEIRQFIIDKVSDNGADNCTSSVLEFPTG